MSDEARDLPTDPPRRAEEATVVGPAMTFIAGRPATSDSHPTPALIADRYRLSRELGRGGAAIVWLAHDTTDGRDVAVKILRSEVANTVASTRFLEEIRIVSEMEHPRLLPILASGEWDGLLYYVTPYVEGGSLRARLERERQLPLDDALAIVTDVAEALEYAHARGVIHRDIKPENILVEGDHAIVADFGIARALTRASGDRITSTGIAIGTPAYMSPEQASGNRDIDHRTDIYSLGCVLYELLAGVTPFVGPTPESVIAQRFLHAPHPLRAYRPTLPPAIDQVVARAMAVAPADRHRTVRELREELRVAASRAAADTRPARGWSKRRIVVGGGILALAAAVLATYVATTRSKTAATPDPTRYVVGEVSVANAGVRVDDARRRMTDAFRRWRDLTVEAPDDADAIELSRTPSGIAKLASRTGAGHVVLAQLRSVGDSVELSARLVGANGTPARQFAQRVGVRDSLGVSRLFVGAAAALVSETSPDSLSDDWYPDALGTERATAWRAYARARIALTSWDLTTAIARLRDAVAADPQYAVAQLWLAQTLAWSRPERPLEWQRDALRAASLAAGLSTFDSLQAAGLAHLASERFPEARAAFERARSLQPTRDIAWYGIAQAQALDPRVIRDVRSPSGWTFRSSYHSAALAYDSALSHAAGAPSFAFDRLRRLLIVEPFRVRAGKAAPPDTHSFSAHPSLIADTLAFVPYPAGALQMVAPHTVPQTFALALQRTADRLGIRMQEWVRRAPGNANALTQLALAQEVRAERESNGGLAALVTFRSALRASSDSLQRVVLGVAITRMLVKDERFAEAHYVADSLLRANPHPTPAQATRLAGVAALIGAVAHAERLLAIQESDESNAPAEEPPLAVREAAARLTAAAALGVCGDHLSSLVRAVDDQIDRYVAPEKRAKVRASTLARPLGLAVPCLGTSALARVSNGMDPLSAMQLAVGRGDPAKARAHFTALERVRRGYRAGDIALDNTFQEAWLLLSLGDSLQAERHLCVPASAMSTLGTNLLLDVPQAAAVGRSLAFCARAAASRGDSAAARRWAAGAATLWKSADPSLQPLVAELRPLARP